MVVVVDVVVVVIVVVVVVVVEVVVEVGVGAGVGSGVIVVVVVVVVEVVEVVEVVSEVVVIVVVVELRAAAEATLLMMPLKPVIRTATAAPPKTKTKNTHSPIQRPFEHCFLVETAPGSAFPLGVAPRSLDERREAGSIKVDSWTRVGLLGRPAAAGSNS